MAEANEAATAQLAIYKIDFIKLKERLSLEGDGSLSTPSALDYVIAH